MSMLALIDPQPGGPVRPCRDGGGVRALPAVAGRSPGRRGGGAADGEAKARRSGTSVLGIFIQILGFLA